MKYQVYDGTIFKTELAAAFYLKDKTEEICKDIIFVQFKDGLTIDTADSYDILESFLHTGDFVHFCEFFSKTSAIYIKTTDAALRLTSMCNDKVSRGAGSKFDVGLNLYFKCSDLFIPFDKVKTVSEAANEILFKPIEEWIKGNL